MKCSYDTQSKQECSGPKKKRVEAACSEPQFYVWSYVAADLDSTFCLVRLSRKQDGQIMAEALAPSRWKTKSVHTRTLPIRPPMTSSSCGFMHRAWLEDATVQEGLRGEISAAAKIEFRLHGEVYRPTTSVHVERRWQRTCFVRYIRSYLGNYMFLLCAN